MDLKELTDNKLFIAVLVLFAVIGLALIAEPHLVNKTTQKVIQELRSGRYTPGPYAPGFDPDQVDPNFFRQNQRPQQQPNNDWPPQPTRFQNDWNDSWEK